MANAQHVQLDINLTQQVKHVKLLVTVAMIQIVNFAVHLNHAGNVNQDIKLEVTLQQFRQIQ